MSVRLSQRIVIAEKHQSDELDVFVNAALGRKSGRLVILDLRQISPVADYFIICSAKSTRQAGAIADHIRSEVRKTGRRTIGIDGLNESQWVLLDYGSVMVHIFYEPVRDFYDLEGLWIDAPRIETDAMVKAALKGDESLKKDTGDNGDDW